MAQDNVSNEGQPFAVGFLLEELTAHTVDEDGKKTFATHNPMALLRKVHHRHPHVETLTLDLLCLEQRLLNIVGLGQSNISA